ncbi:hypothetical protein O3P69_017805 [Scylla paramamosain]|uniref:Uncharacterized protein n=1 Tax=Scylla paramamosain TaxID=85552 RepID=A0AAW0SK17_SCYPA
MKTVVSHKALNSGVPRQVPAQCPITEQQLGGAVQTPPQPRPKPGDCCYLLHNVNALLRWLEHRRSREVELGAGQEHDHTKELGAGQVQDHTKELGTGQVQDHTKELGAGQVQNHTKELGAGKEKDHTKELGAGQEGDHTKELEGEQKGDHAKWLEPGREGDPARWLIKEAPPVACHIQPCSTRRRATRRLPHQLLTAAASADEALPHQHGKQ